MSSRGEESSSIIIKTADEIKRMREGGRILAAVARDLSGLVAPGLSGEELNGRAELLIKKHGGEPAFRGYRGYPASICVSVNDEVVHSLPEGKVFGQGDIVSIDLGLKYKGMITDMAVTAAAGKVSAKAKRLMNVTREALQAGIDAVRPGNFTGDIGAAVSEVVERAGFSAVRTLVGHGVGREIHEEPPVPNFGRRGEGAKLEPGMAIAIEPMVNTGSEEVKLQDDGWTFKTVDGGLSAHFEHTIAVTEDGREVLTQE